MNHQNSKKPDLNTAQTQAQTLTTDEKQRLLNALEVARENAKPTVKRLMESESVSNELLSMRLGKPATDDLRKH
jgi:hypothetical protein